MDPIFRKCLLAITKINEDLLPEMGYKYNQFSEDIKNEILNHHCLNRSRQYTKAAIEAKNSSLIDNNHVKISLNSLADLDRSLDRRSKDIHSRLNDVKSRFIKRSKEISKKNNQYLHLMKDGDVPAQDLLKSIVALGKDTQKVINEEIPFYKKEIMSFLKKIEEEICDDAYRHYTKIIKLDSGTFPTLKTREWTYLPDELFSRRGAFVNTDYNI